MSVEYAVMYRVENMEFDLEWFNGNYPSTERIAVTDTLRALNIAAQSGWRLVAIDSYGNLNFYLERIKEKNQ